MSFWASAAHTSTVVGLLCRAGVLMCTRNSVHTSAGAEAGSRVRRHAHRLDRVWNVHGIDYRAPQQPRRIVQRDHNRCC